MWLFMRYITLQRSKSAPVEGVAGSWAVERAMKAIVWVKDQLQNHSYGQIISKKQFSRGKWMESVEESAP